VFGETLNQIFEQALEDEEMERELETYHEALQSCRAFLEQFSLKPQRPVIGEYTTYDY